MRHFERKRLCVLFQTQVKAVGLFLTLKWLQNSHLGYLLALLSCGPLRTGCFLGMLESLLLHSCSFQTKIIVHPKHVFVKMVWITAQTPAL